MDKQFGDRLKEARIRKGLTQAELAELIDEKLRPERYSLYETGKSVPHPRRLRRIAEVLEIDEEWLREGDSLPAYPASEGASPLVREAIDLRQQLLEAREQECARLRQEVLDLREVALDTFEFWDRFRDLIEQELVPLFVKNADANYAEHIRGSYDWAVDIIERQLDALSQRSRREAEHQTRPVKDLRPIDFDDSQRGYAKRRRPGQGKNNRWPRRPEAEEKESDGEA